MILTKAQKILLLLFTIFPPIVFMLIHGLLMSPSPPVEQPLWVDAATWLVTVAVLVVYFRHLIKDPYMSRNSKTLWGILFILVTTISMIVYWFMHIWPEPEPDTE